MTATRKLLIDAQQLSELFEALTRRGYQVFGPTLREEAIIYERLNSIEDLPKGWTDWQEAGKYRVKKLPAELYFHYNVGPHSWKKFLFPPKRRVWRAEKEQRTFQITPEPIPETKMAFFGIKACELKALFIQDRVFQSKDFTDTFYASLRKNVFLIAANCTKAGGNCFCVSMNSGPRAIEGFDLAITELFEAERHGFVIEAGSEQGETILNSLSGREVSSQTETMVDTVLSRTVKQMTKSLQTEGIKELLYRQHDNPRWEKIAQQCLSCANCTMVCPTCFCSTVEDTSDLTGDHSERWKRWDSCFTLDFSYVHGGSVRSSTASRYRQWMTHKLASWQDQFDSSGCVGCGRCVTWCPVGIDITEEVGLIRKSDETPQMDCDHATV